MSNKALLPLGGEKIESHARVCLHCGLTTEQRFLCTE